MKFTPTVDYQSSVARATELCSKLSLEEKADFVRGHDGFFIRQFPEHGIPFVYMTDASQGIHIRRNLDDSLIRQPEKTVAFPCLLTVAASWNHARPASTTD